ncbi:MAG: MFS transporter [archaeon]
MDFKPKKQKVEVYDEKRKSRNYSIKDGFFHSIMVGFGETFISPFAIFLKASASQLALLSSLPLLAGSLSQLFTPKALEIFKSRKKLVAVSVLLQALIWIPIMYAFYLGGFAVPYLIFFAVMYWVLGMFLNPAWNSWMGDIVNPEVSGRYFGFRNRVVGISALLSLLVGGFVLNSFQDASKVSFTGFAVIFSIALVARLISFFYILRKHEPKFVVYEGAKFTFVEFVKQMHFRNYGLFVIYLSLMNFSVYIAAPFFSAYMLNGLRFSYLTFTVVTGAAMFGKIVFMPFWGKLIDKYGSKKILSLCGYLMPFSPLLWVLSPDVTHLIIFQLYSGLTWSGFELAASSFIFDSTTAPKRARCIAYYNVVNGVMILIGTLVGAFLIKHPIYFSSFLFVFFASGILRLATSIFMIPKIKEVRTVSDISYSHLLFKVVSVVPTETFSMFASFWNNNKPKPFRKF